MKHDDIDDLLAQGLRDYNAPPAVPREELWQRIAQARATANADRAESSDPSMPPTAAQAHRTRWTWTTVGIAASLLLAAGIGIGRWIEHRPSAAPAIASTPHASTPDTAAAQPGAEPQQLASAGASDGRSRGGAATDAGRDTGATHTAGASPASSGSGASSANMATAGRSAPLGRAGAADNLAYRLVVLQHLAGSEALITAFRSSARTGHMDPQIARWSRDLLSTTRLLEASQANSDPVMKRLLGDLDLVITQIVQYSAHDSVDTEELDLIERSINSRGVITKLRSTLPGRTSPVGS